MIGDTLAVVLFSAGFIVLICNVVFLSRRLKTAELRAVLAEVALKQH